MAFINHGVVEIPVVARFAKGFPEHAEGEPATYGPATEAFETTFPFDAHFAAYSQPTIARRLAGAGAFAYKPKMVLLVIDVDGPDHKRTPEWWAVEREKVHAFFKKYGGGYCYTTKGGYRIVGALGDELVIDSPAAKARWSVSYEAWLDQIEREFGIVGDRNCADWTRLYRLPRVVRDGVPTVPEEEIGRAARIWLKWREPYVATDDPRLTRSDVSIDVPEPAPVSPEQLEAGAEALIKSWPARSRHYAGMALCGALAKSGWSEGAIADFVCYVMWKTVGDPEETKWTKQARDVLDKLHRGEQVTGWATLEDLMCTGADAQPDETRRADVRSAISTAKNALGMDPAALFPMAGKKPTVREQYAAAVAAGDPAVAGLTGDQRFEQLLDEAAGAIVPAFEIARKSKDRKRDATDAKPMFSTLGDVIKRDIPPPEFLVDNLVPADGVGALSGEPKSGKSWDAMHICVALATGRSVFGRFAVQKAVGSAYFSIEDTEAAVKTRMLAIARSLDLNLEGDWVERVAIQARGRELDVCSEFDMSLFVASIWRLEEERATQIRYVQLDPLSDLHARKEDSRDEMAIVMGHFRAVQKILSTHAGAPVAIAFVHHSGKESADQKSRKRGGQRMRGSSAIHGAVDFGIYVSHPTGDQTEFIGRVESEVKAARGGGIFERTITVEDDARGNAIRASWETGDVSELEGPTDLVGERAFDIVNELFKHGDGPLTTRVLQRKIGGKTKILCLSAEIAEEQGWIAQKFNGKTAIGYAITEAGKNLIRNGGTKPAEVAS